MSDKVENKSDDISENRFYFYAPHPGGIKGCMYPLPEPVEDAVKMLDGQTTTITQAMEILRRAVSDLRNKSMKVRCKIDKPPFTIVLEQGSFEDCQEGKRWNLWSLISFRAAK